MAYLAMDRVEPGGNMVQYGLFSLEFVYHKPSKARMTFSLHVGSFTLSVLHY